MVLSSNSRPPDRGERGTGQGTIGSVTKGKEMGDVFILGSGFSKAIHSAMPTLDELSQEVITRLRQLPYPIESPLNELDENIELWITYVSQRQPWLPDSENDYNGALARRIREQIFDVIEERTSIASEKEPPSWVGKLIRSWHHERATIVTLNYDTLIERVAKGTKISEKEVRILSSQIYPPYFADVQARSGGSLWGEGGSQDLLPTEAPWVYQLVLFGKSRILWRNDSVFGGPTKREHALGVRKVPPPAVQRQRAVDNPPNTRENDLFQ